LSFSSHFLYELSNEIVLFSFADSKVQAAFDQRTKVKRKAKETTGVPDDTELEEFGPKT
jgi:hypothetical protein